MSRTISLNLLDSMRIASPCSARWEDMRGSDTVRRCAECNLNVHNFSAMQPGEAEALLRKHFDADGRETSERFCARWYRRADGTAILADCPVGFSKVRASARRTVARIAALCGLTTLVGLVAASVERKNPVDDGAGPARRLAPFTAVASWLSLQPPKQSIIMGKMCVLPPPKPPATPAPTQPPGDSSEQLQ